MWFRHNATALQNRSGGSDTRCWEPKTGDQPNCHVLLAKDKLAKYAGKLERNCSVTYSLHSKRT